LPDIQSAKNNLRASSTGHSAKRELGIQLSPMMDENTKIIVIHRTKLENSTILWAAVVRPLLLTGEEGLEGRKRLLKLVRCEEIREYRSG
jgi:hypothetical protein